MPLTAPPWESTSPLPSLVISPNGGYLNYSSNVVITGRGKLTNLWCPAWYATELGRLATTTEASNGVAYALGLRGFGYSDESIRTNLINNTFRTGSEYTNKYPATADVYLANTNYVIEYNFDGGTNWITYTNPIAMTATTNLYARVRKTGTTDNRTVYAYLPSDPALAQFNWLPASWLTNYFGTNFLSNTNAAPTADPDHDGLNNFQEYQAGTNPTNSDTDYDGQNDGQEVAAGTNPLDASSVNSVRLGYWRFNTNSWAGEQGQLPIAATALNLLPSWSGTAVGLNTNITANLKYHDVETNALANINCRAGTVRFWYQAGWSSTNDGGVGPGGTARLLEMGDGTSSGGYWTLYINSDGTQLTFATATNGTTTTYFTGAISWATNEWHQIALTYSPSGTALYADGAALQSGSGIVSYPSLAARGANGFSLGGNRSGGELAMGSFDELETFNYPLSGDDVAANYNGILDPTSVPLSVSFTNKYVQSTLETATVSGGVSASMAVLVNSTNFSSATFSLFNVTTNVDLGAGDGLRQVWFGFKGLSGTTNWSMTRVIVDNVAPAIVITNPVSSTTSRPILQLQGYSLEPLSSLTYGLTNAAGTLSNQMGITISQFYDTNSCVFTTNYFQCFDLELTNGSNLIVLHATDLAGNVTVTNLSYTLDYTGVTNAPVVTLYWPTNGTLASGSAFTWRGALDDPSAEVSAQAVTNGVTNVVSGAIGRDGLFWIEDVPLGSGTNTVILTAVDGAGNASVTNISVIQSSVTITIDDTSGITGFGTNVSLTGTVTGGGTVTVNGVATVVTGTNWAADIVPVDDGNNPVVMAMSIRRRA